MATSMKIAKSPYDSDIVRVGANLFAQPLSSPSIVRINSHLRKNWAASEEKQLEMAEIFGQRIYSRPTKTHFQPQLIFCIKQKSTCGCTLLTYRQNLQKCVYFLIFAQRAAACSAERSILAATIKPPLNTTELINTNLKLQTPANLTAITKGF